MILPDMPAYSKHDHTFRTVSHGGTSFLRISCVKATITLYPIGRLVRATITLYPTGRPVRAIITLYPIGRPVRTTITLYPIGRPVRATITLYPTGDLLELLLHWIL